ncbi:hypothetical protein [Pectobacterium polaris]|nr:hypothetical protein [Pectobacterium polaris]
MTPTISVKEVCAPAIAFIQHGFFFILAAIVIVLSSILAAANRIGS